MVEFRNSNGAVNLFDGGTPRTLTIKARANISGGYWVNGSSAGGVVSSGADSYAASDIEGYPVSSQIGSKAIGIALADIASGTYGTVARRGDFIMPSLSGTKVGSIAAGDSIVAGSAGTVWKLGSTTGYDNTYTQLGVGRSMSTGGKDGEYVVISVNI